MEREELAKVKQNKHANGASLHYIIDMQIYKIQFEKYNLGIGKM